MGVVSAVESGGSSLSEDSCSVGEPCSVGEVWKGGDEEGEVTEVSSLESGFDGIGDDWQEDSMLLGGDAGAGVGVPESLRGVNWAINERTRSTTKPRVSVSRLQIGRDYTAPPVGCSCYYCYYCAGDGECQGADIVPAVQLSI